MSPQIAVTSVLSMDHITWPETGEQVTVGSCGYYVAMALAHLGADVLYAGAHGDDFDPVLVEPLRAAGAVVELCPLPGATARLDLVYTATGEIAHVHYDEAGGTAFTADDLPATFWNAPTLWLGTAPHAFHQQVAERAAQQNQRVFLSTQGEYRGGKADLTRLAPYLSGIFSNVGEVSSFGYGDFAAAVAHLRECNPRLTLLITHGAHGAWLLTDETAYHVPAAPCPNLVNTVGAGDTFAAAWLLQTLNGNPPAEALPWAGAAAALQMRGYGYTAQPSAEEVEAYLQPIKNKLAVVRHMRINLA
ncbi:MAG: carbohydrate kinase family protein [Anaerolineaceae bacterium]|nr:carbohydrate kinase family protein [Anaerolineaceae bacterium]